MLALYLYKNAEKIICSERDISKIQLDVFAVMGGCFSKPEEITLKLKITCF